MKLIINYVSAKEISENVETILGMPQESKDALAFLVRKAKK